MAITIFARLQFTYAIVADSHVTPGPGQSFSCSAMVLVQSPGKVTGHIERRKSCRVRPTISICIEVGSKFNQSVK